MKLKIILPVLLLTGSIILMVFLLRNTCQQKVSCDKCKESAPKNKDTGGGNEILDGSLNHLIVYTRK